MGFKSASNSNNVKHSNGNYEDEDLILGIKHSNGNYEVDGIIFPSRFVFTTVESIDRNLRFLYTPGSASNDFDTINHSPVRDNDEEFDAILARVEERIGIITSINDTKQFLYKEKGGDFFGKFRGINDCIIKGVYLNGESKNKFKRRIINIVRSLCYIGINPF